MTQGMRSIVVGLGVQGSKRRKFAAEDVVATVDSLKDANFKNVQDVPLDTFDAALVCTPDSTKFEILRYLLTHQKHVLVEKPLIGPDSELGELQKLAVKQRTVLYTAYNHRFEPHIVTIKSLLKSGILGTPYVLRIFYGNGTARDVRNSTWRDFGCGVLSDIGSHLLDLYLFLFDVPRHDFKSITLANLENRSPDYVSFVANGATPIVQFEASLLSWRNSFYLDLIGENGSAHIDCLCKWGPSTLTLRTRRFPSGRPEESRETIELSDPTWHAEYSHFRNLCINHAAGNTMNDIWINKTLHFLGKELR